MTQRSRHVINLGKLFSSALTLSIVAACGPPSVELERVGEAQAAESLQPDGNSPRRAERPPFADETDEIFRREHSGR